MKPTTAIHLGITIALTIHILTTLLHLHLHLPPLLQSLQLPPQHTWISDPPHTSAPPSRDAPRARIAKVTVRYPRSPYIYDRVLAVHDEQNRRFGYAMCVHRDALLKGGADLLVQLTATLTEMLRGPVEERVEWLLYFDPSVLPTHPHLPLDHLLPPTASNEQFKTTLFIFPRSKTGSLATSVFWVRVHAEALVVLAAAVVRLAAATDWSDGDVVAAALGWVVERRELRGRVVWHPACWYGCLSSSPSSSSSSSVDKNPSSSSFFQQPRSGGAFQRLRDLEDAVDGVKGGRLGSGNGDGDIGVLLREVDRYWEVAGEGKRVLSRVNESGGSEAWGQLVGDIRG